MIKSLVIMLNNTIKKWQKCKTKPLTSLSLFAVDWRKPIEWAKCLSADSFRQTRQEHEMTGNVKVLSIASVWAGATSMLWFMKGAVHGGMLVGSMVAILIVAGILTESIINAKPKI